MNDSPRMQLDRGIAILTPCLDKHGFVYSSESEGSGSGGPFASGSFTRDLYRLSLHHRRGLGIVTFAFGELVVPHADYIEFLGSAGESKLLWMPISEGINRYHALSFDLEHLCSDFTTGDASMLTNAAKDYATRVAESGAQLNAEAVGDIEKRRLARDAFKNSQYEKVLELMGSIVYPDLASKSEARMIEIARSRTNGI